MFLKNLLTMLEIDNKNEEKIKVKKSTQTIELDSVDDTVGKYEEAIEKIIQEIEKLKIQLKIS